MDLERTAGKALYITDLSFSAWGYNATDRDNNQMGGVSVEDVTAGVVMAFIAGNGGGSQQLSKPAKSPAGNTVRLHAFNNANHILNISAYAKGFEV